MNGVYAFDPVTYRFNLLSASTLDPQFRTSDCCAIGVTVPHGRGDGKGEERIDPIGGGNDFASPLPYVQYYSITHDRWKRVADLNLDRRHVGCASVKQRGKPLIYAIGGGNETTGEALRSIEVYDVLNDKWTLYDDFFPEGGGRTRMSVQSVDDRVYPGDWGGCELHRRRVPARTPANHGRHHRYQVRHHAHLLR